MEARYVVVQKYTKELCRNYAAVTRRLAKHRWILPVLIIAMIIVSFANLAFDSISFAIMGFTFAFFFFVWVLFLPEIIGKQTYKAQSKALNNDGLSIAFFDDCFENHTSVSDEKLQYNAIERIVENDVGYFLYNSKNSAFLIDKKAFTKGDAESFRAFISEKTGKTIEKVKCKTNTKNKIVILCAVFALTVITLVCAGIYSAYQKSQPKDFTLDGCTFTLTGAFEESELNSDDDGYLELYSDGASVTVYTYDMPYTTSDDTVLSDFKTFAEYWKAEYKEWEYTDITLSFPKDGVYRVQYMCYDWYYCEYGFDRDGKVYAVGFGCENSNWGKYAPLFEHWAATIRFDGE